MKDKMISLDEDLYNRIRSLAEDDVRTLRGMIRVMVSDYEKRKGKKKNAVHGAKG